MFMIIEAENYELLMEYILINQYPNEEVLPYLEGKKRLNVTTDRNTQDLFNDEFSIVLVESIDPDMTEGYYWINKLMAEDKRVIKKNNLDTVTLKKITKSLTPKLEKELNFQSKITEYTSYQAIVEEEYLFTLGEGYSKKEEFQPLLFMYGINDLSKFYKKITDDEMQLILSLIYSKALKVGNETLAKKVMTIDKTIKTSNGVLNQKNIWGVSMFR
jgi:hypothetical protein